MQLDKHILHGTLGALNHAVFVLQVEGDRYKLVFANTATSQLLGTSGPIEGLYLTDLLTGGQKRWIRRHLATVIRQQSSLSRAFPTEREVEKAQHLYLTLTPFMDSETGEVTHISGSVEIQTESVRSRHTHRNQQRYVSALEQAPYGVCFVSLTGKTTMVNRTLSHWLDRSLESFSTLGIENFIHVDDAQVFAQALLKVRTGMRSYGDFEIRLQLPEKLLWASVSMSSIQESEKDGYVIIQFVDITKRKAHEEELTRLATRDHLTGISNRMIFDDAIKLAAKKAERYNRPGAVVYIDLDDFKSINDRYGHKAGDQALQEVAHVLKHVFRETDVVCRIGGDEFAVIMHEVMAGEAQAKVHQVEQEIARLQIRAHGKNVRISASIGLQTYDGKLPLDIEALIESADKNMYAKKTASKESWRSRA